MPGPPPKDARIRQRRNRASTRAVLPPHGSGRKAPPLPDHRRRWHARTRAWWRDVWASPMAARYLQADLHGLYVVVELVEQFWRAPTPEAAREIRLSAQPYGLNPIDRRRLQWEMREGPEEESREQEAPPHPAPAEDPRKVLTMVKR